MNDQSLASATRAPTLTGAMRSTAPRRLPLPARPARLWRMTMKSLFQPYRTVSYVVLTVLGLGVHQLACADMGVKLTDPTNRVAYENDHAVSLNAINSGWDPLRAPVCHAMSNLLGQGNLIRSGVTLYKIDCNLNDVSQLNVRLIDNQTVEVSFVIQNNYLAATSTTPTVLGSYGDPRFSVNYDLDFTVRLTVPANLQNIYVQQASVALANVNVDSHNFIGDLAQMAASVVQFFGGPDFKARLEAAMNAQKFDFSGVVNNALQPADQAIAQLRSHGYTALHSNIYWASNSLMLALSAYTPTLAPQPQGCFVGESAYLCGGVRVDCSNTPNIVALQRWDNNFWHDVTVDTNLSRLNLELYDYPGDHRDSGSYRVCTRNGVGDNCTTPIVTTFHYDTSVACPAQNTGGGNGGGGGGGGVVKPGPKGPQRMM